VVGFEVRKNMQVAELRDIIARQRAGWSLEQPFYTNRDLFEFERRTWLAEQWYVLGHVSEIPEPGAYVVRELLGESLIILRDTDHEIRGFFNVCRHRGSRICRGDGTAKTLVCPYHSWSYRLDGSLRSAPAMSADIDLSNLNLHAVPVVNIGGVLLGSLQADPQNLSGIRSEAGPMLEYHGIPSARIAARRNYPTAANWKLVMENFAECYHCFPSHPEYCSVMAHVNVVARKATPEVAAQWDRDVERWYREEADPRSPAGNIQPDYSARGRQVISRAPIGGGRKTESQDGEPVAPLMGRQTKFDGGFGSFALSPFVSLIMPNDHAILFQFLPVEAEHTDVIINWLVDGRAKESDVDIDRMVWLWDVTTVQDKALVELNAAGVRSRSYVPGPYSLLEPGANNIVRDYLKGLSSKVAGLTPP
jgi:phenylpropionate dioxygenase-like ring-hydroxylating dioxygenase large terminal subunit